MNPSGPHKFAAYEPKSRAQARENQQKMPAAGRGAGSMGAAPNRWATGQMSGMMNTNSGYGMQATPQQMYYMQQQQQMYYMQQQQMMAYQQQQQQQMFPQQSASQSFPAQQQNMFGQGSQMNSFYGAQTQQSAFQTPPQTQTAPKTDAFDLFGASQPAAAAPVAAAPAPEPEKPKSELAQSALAPPPMQEKKYKSLISDGKYGAPVFEPKAQTDLLGQLPATPAPAPAQTAQNDLFGMSTQPVQTAPQNSFFAPQPAAPAPVQQDNFFAPAQPAQPVQPAAPAQQENFFASTQPAAQDDFFSQKPAAQPAVPAPAVAQQDDFFAQKAPEPREQAADPAPTPAAQPEPEMKQEEPKPAPQPKKPLPRKSNITAEMFMTTPTQSAILPSMRKDQPAPQQAQGGFSPFDDDYYVAFARNMTPQQQQAAQQVIASEQAALAQAQAQIQSQMQSQVAKPQESPKKDAFAAFDTFGTSSSAPEPAKETKDDKFDAFASFDAPKTEETPKKDAFAAFDAFSAPAATPVTAEPVKETPKKDAFDAFASFDAPKAQESPKKDDKFAAFDAFSAPTTAPAPVVAEPVAEVSVKSSFASPADDPFGDEYYVEFAKSHKEEKPVEPTPKPKKDAFAAFDAFGAPTPVAEPAKSDKFDAFASFDAPAAAPKEDAFAAFDAFGTSSSVPEPAKETKSDKFDAFAAFDAPAAAPKEDAFAAFDAFSAPAPAATTSSTSTFNDDFFSSAVSSTSTTSAFALAPPVRSGRKSHKAPLEIKLPTQDEPKKDVPPMEINLPQQEKNNDFVTSELFGVSSAPITPEPSASQSSFNAFDGDVDDDDDLFSAPPSLPTKIGKEDVPPPRPPKPSAAPVAVEEVPPEVPPPTKPFSAFQNELFAKVSQPPPEVSRETKPTALGQGGKVNSMYGFEEPDFEDSAKAPEAPPVPPKRSSKPKKSKAKSESEDSFATSGDDDYYFADKTSSLSSLSDFSGTESEGHSPHESEDEIPPALPSLGGPPSKPPPPVPRPNASPVPELTPPPPVPRETPSPAKSEPANSPAPLPAAIKKLDMNVDTNDLIKKLSEDELDEYIVLFRKEVFGEESEESENANIKVILQKKMDNATVKRIWTEHQTELSGSSDKRALSKTFVVSKRDKNDKVPGLFICEFIIGMHLINLSAAGEELPDVVSRYQWDLIDDRIYESDAVFQSLRTGSGLGPSSTPGFDGDSLPTLVLPNELPAGEGKSNVLEVAPVVDHEANVKDIEGFMETYKLPDNLREKIRTVGLQIEHIPRVDIDVLPGYDMGAVLEYMPIYNAIYLNRKNFFPEGFSKETKVQKVAEVVKADNGLPSLALPEGVTTTRKRRTNTNFRMPGERTRDEPAKQSAVAQKAMRFLSHDTAWKGSDDESSDSDDDLFREDVPPKLPDMSAPEPEEEEEDPATRANPMTATENLLRTQKTTMENYFNGGALRRPQRLAAPPSLTAATNAMDVEKERYTREAVHTCAPIFADLIQCSLTRRYFQEVGEERRNVSFEIYNCFVKSWQNILLFQRALESTVSAGLVPKKDTEILLPLFNTLAPLQTMIESMKPIVTSWNRLKSICEVFNSNAGAWKLSLGSWTLVAHEVVHNIMQLDIKKSKLKFCLKQCEDMISNHIKAKVNLFMFFTIISQHIKEMEALTTRLFNATPLGHPSYEEAKKMLLSVRALSKLDGLMVERDAKAKKDLAAYTEQFSKYTSHPKDFFKYGRTLLHQGEVNIHRKDKPGSRMLFVFNDYLFMGKKAGKKFHSKEHTVLANAVLKDIPDGTAIYGHKIRNAFAVSSNQNTVVMFCNSPEEKKKVVMMIQDALDKQNADEALIHAYKNALMDSLRS